MGIMVMNNNLPDYENETLDAIWEEMLLFSAIPTEIIELTLQIAEENDEVFELLCKWFKSQNTMERKNLEYLIDEEVSKCPSRN